ncbi:MAG: hypothetical protein Q9169_000207 [Polycauliona sp. 2 TL-2023]
MPTLPGQENFGSPIIHQKDFGQSTVLSTPGLERIAVLGGAKSAADLVYDCVQAGKKVTWIIRKTGTGPGLFVSTESKISPRTIYALGTIRFMTTLSPSLFNVDSLWNRFLQRTRVGRKQVMKFWDATDKTVSEAPNFEDRGPEARKNGFQNLKPVTPVFWQNQGAGIINRPNFWDIIAQNVQVHYEDIQEIHRGNIRLKSGEDVRSDAILCGTGWVPSLSFFDSDMLANLGVPQPVETFPPESAKLWKSLEKEADQQVLKRFPILADPPDHYHVPATETPYRLYNGIASLQDSSIAFVGHVLIANYFRVAECQAIWATAYLDGKVKLPPLEQRQKDVALFVAWCRRRYLSNGERGHWMSAEQTGYTDRLFHELGLTSHRRFWLWDAFVPSSKKDLHRVHAEYIAKFGRDDNPQAQESLPYRPTPTSNPRWSDFGMPAELQPYPESYEATTNNNKPMVSTSRPQPSPQGPAVYIVRMLEGWRVTPSSPVMKVDILGVFWNVRDANEYTRQWLKDQLPPTCYRYGENEVPKEDGGIQVDLLTEKMDGSLLVDVEKHFVDTGGAGAMMQGS